MLVCFSHVAISTVSLGVLKASHKTMFKPALPDQKVKQFLQYSRNGKPINSTTNNTKGGGD